MKGFPLHKGGGTFKKEVVDIVSLVGTNPLPVFVSVARLSQRYVVRNIYLVCSEQSMTQSGTIETGKRLKKFFQQKLGLADCSCISISDVSRKSEIDLVIDEWLSKHTTEDTCVHLDYTGGTKAMSVHSHEFIRERLGKRATFSYLDARTHSLFFDNELPGFADLRHDIFISIEELLELHGYELKEVHKETGEFLDTLLVLKNQVDQGSIKRFLKDWKDKLRPMYKEEESGIIQKASVFRRRIEDDHQIASIAKNIPANLSEETLAVLSALPDDRKLLDGYGCLLRPTEESNREFRNRASKSAEFLDGKWLELIVLDAIPDELEGEPIASGANLVAHRPDLPQFELDVYAMRGYQLLAISTTTHDRIPLCKSKGFEVILRARQIGGDESKAMLVTCLGQPECQILEESLAFDTGASRKSFIVCGIDDLVSLSERIKYLLE
ncbi:MAG TPA: hypothetical protein DCE14_08650 [Kosmotogaceae bacterium]|nr:hypothetical protein [Kosmotogaceae bacterium]